MTELEAGPELDALIAVHIFGWRWVSYPWYDGTIKQYLQAPDGDPPHGDDFYVFDDDTRITDWNFGGWSDTWDGAGLVVEQMRSMGWHYQLADGFDGQQTAVLLWGKSWWHDPDKAYKARAPMLPLAICRAALLAVGAE